MSPSGRVTCEFEWKRVAVTFFLAPLCQDVAIRICKVEMFMKTNP